MHFKKIVPYEKKDMFDLVLDVASYSRFIPYIKKSNIIKMHEAFFLSELTLNFLSISFKSKVYYDLNRFNYIYAEARSSCLKFLNAKWTFSNEHPDHCCIEFFLDFQIHHRLLNFDFFSFGTQIMTLFEQEAQKRYKKKIFIEYFF